jgi:formyltetrahydrofolate deformylase
MEPSATLLLYCEDRKGLVFALARFILEQWSLATFDLDQEEFGSAFAPLAADYGFSWQLVMGQERPAVAIFVSRYQHCLIDLLYRHQVGELPCRVALVISNHPDARDLASFYNVPFHHIPVGAADKAAAEKQQLSLLEENQVELIVLARYMQVLSPGFVGRYTQKIINVHHSFLPAFVGAKPYHAAFQRGVKLIGATSHYVTQVLDEGPIIEQDVTRICHRDRVDDLIGKGRDLERVVLSRAVRWHLEQRILCYGNKTVVFD